FSEVPARLGGWGLAAAAGICAHMLLWPARPRAGLRRDAAKAAAALAEVVEAELAGDREAIASREQVARDAVDGLRRSYLTAPHRPSGPIGPMAAAASLVDELDWLRSFLALGPAFLRSIWAARRTWRLWPPQLPCCRQAPRPWPAETRGLIFGGSTPRETPSPNPRSRGSRSRRYHLTTSSSDLRSSRFSDRKSVV